MCVACGRWSSMTGAIGQIIEFRDSRLMCYHLHLKVVAGSVPCSATNSKSPNPFRAFSLLPAAPVLAGLRGFASRAAPIPFPRFLPFAASLFFVFIYRPRERARGYFLYWCGFRCSRLCLETGNLRRPKDEIAPNRPRGLARQPLRSVDDTQALLDSETCQTV